MPNKLQKSLQDYLSKIKAPHSSFNSISSSKSWILSGCRHPKTPSFAIDRRNESHGWNNNNGDAATLSDVDRFLIENFKSLYLRDDDDNNNTRSFSQENQETPKLGTILFDSPRFLEPPPGLCGSNRFFVNPGLSGSLVEDPLTSLTTTCDEGGSSSTSTATFNYSSSNSRDHHHEKEAMETLPDNCIAVLTYSPTPFEEFRRSMQDVVETRSKNHERVDWDFMEELLFCYLNLNDKKSYKFILSAFVDLIVVLRQRSKKVPAKPQSVRTFRFGRETRRKKMKEVTYEFGSS